MRVGLGLDLFLESRLELVLSVGDYMVKVRVRL